MSFVMHSNDPSLSSTSEKRNESSAKTYLVKLMLKTTFLVLIYFLLFMVFSRYYIRQPNDINQGSSNSVNFNTSTELGIKIDELAGLTNIERAKAGLKVLKINELLSLSANLKCQEMVSLDYWSHNSPDGQEPWKFFKLAGYRYTKAGENLAYGYTASNEVIKGWMNSQEHRENIINPHYTEVGFAICDSNDFINQGHQIIIVQHFGHPFAPSTH